MSNNKKKNSVRIRTKVLADGRESIYLDIYKDGKRTYKFLKLYYKPEIDKTTELENFEVKQKAEREWLNAKQDLDIDGEQIVHHLTLNSWMEYFIKQQMMQTRGDSTTKIVQYTIERLKEFKTDDVKLKDVDKAFCEGFVNYLRTAKNAKNGESLSSSTQALYLAAFNRALRLAVIDGKIDKNPMEMVKNRIKVPEKERVFLVEEEIDLLIANDQVKNVVKQAFLFSCFTGLRISDIIGLKWGDLNKNSNGRFSLTKRMQKTQRIINFTLHPIAERYLPPREGKKDNDNVFELPCQATMFYELKSWAAASGIKKKISFHTARHTFATLLLTKGADLYAISKLLGHTKIATTEIYGKIIDKKKDEALSHLDDLF